MTPQERQMLADLFERVRSTATGARDPEAEAFIGEAVRAQPYAPYVLAQTTLVQQHALEAAAQRIAELEARAAARRRRKRAFWAISARRCSAALRRRRRRAPATTRAPIAQAQAIRSAFADPLMRRRRRPAPGERPPRLRPGAASSPTR